MSFHVRLADGAVATLSDSTFADNYGTVQFRGTGASTAAVSISGTSWTGSGAGGEAALEVYDVSSLSISDSTMDDFAPAPAGAPVIGVLAYSTGELIATDLSIDLGDGSIPTENALQGGVGLVLYGTMNPVTLNNVDISNAGQAAIAILPADPGDGSHVTNIDNMSIDTDSDLTGSGTYPLTVGPFAAMPSGDLISLGDAQITIAGERSGMRIVQSAGSVTLTGETQNTGQDSLLVDDDFAASLQAGEWFEDTASGTWFQYGLNAFSSIQEGVNTVYTAGTVTVSAGTYVENVLINKDLSLLSASGRAATTIEGITGVGALGAVQVTSNTTGVTIGGAGQGFTIVGINGNGAVENAAIYFQGSHSDAQILDNEIVANGDSGLTTEYGATITGFVIDGNEFSGQTFEGTQPSGIGFATQFNVGNNVPRQLVVMGGGTGGGNTSNITFTNNLISGVAGGISSDDGTSEQGNTLVTIDVQGADISGNTFAGTTTRYGSALRARGTNTSISGNTFLGAGMGPQTNYMYLANAGTGNGLSTDPNGLGDVLSANTFDPGAVIVPLTSTNTVFIASQGIQAAIDAATPGEELRFTGEYTENVDLNQALTLGGDFLLSGTLTVSVAGATLDAGFSTGIITSGSLALTSGSTLSAEVNGTIPGTTHDQYVVTGSVSLGGATPDASGTTHDQYVVTGSVSLGGATPDASAPSRPAPVTPLS